MQIRSHHNLEPKNKLSRNILNTIFMGYSPFPVKLQINLLKVPLVTTLCGTQKATLTKLKSTACCPIQSTILNHSFCKSFYEISCNSIHSSSDNLPSPRFEEKIMYTERATEQVEFQLFWKMVSKISSTSQLLPVHVISKHQKWSV